LSSGTDMLNRMKKRGLIREYNDKEDKRSKRIELTPKGGKVLEACQERIRKNATMMASGLNNDDKELCVQLLKATEIKFSALWPQQRNKTFEEVYNGEFKKTAG